ncbi:hypothetical protein Syun_006182 [Stephania yunnanensis]|uniref:Uncharacterized protein n=1 Tax=Stephania yunnanensis TaxID=152371 RepID=A0AAP0KWF8_9MAGN
MGEGRGEEIKRNVEKWRGLARKGVQDGGSSERNLVALLQEMEACTEWQCPKTKFPPIRCMNASRGSSPGYNWIDL